MCDERQDVGERPQIFFWEWLFNAGRSAACAKVARDDWGG
jgi:hypothetical protein